MQLNIRYIVNDCNTEGMCQEAVWLEQGLPRSFLTHAISLQDTTEFKTNTVLSGIKKYHRLILYIHMF